MFKGVLVEVIFGLFDLRLHLLEDELLVLVEGEQVGLYRFGAA